MKSPIFNRTYFIIDCDENNKIVRFFTKENNKHSYPDWIGEDISTIIIKKEDTDKN